MGKKINASIKVGALIYVVYLLTDKFVFQIPYEIAIPVLVLGITLMVTGTVKTYKR